MKLMELAIVLIFFGIVYGTGFFDKWIGFPTGIQLGEWRAKRMEKSGNFEEAARIRSSNSKGLGILRFWGKVSLVLGLVLGLVCFFFIEY